MNPQSLVRAPINRLRKYRCRKCGGMLRQVRDTVECAENHCEQLAIESLTGKTIRENREACEAMDVEENYPQLRTRKVSTKKPKGLYPE